MPGHITSLKPPAGTTETETETQARQGDVLFVVVASIPADAKPKPRVGDIVVAHSETGHHHSFGKNCGVTYYTTNDPFVAYLSVDSPSLLEHHRPNDAPHGAYAFAPGLYQVRRPSEYVSADEERMVQD